MITRSIKIRLYLFLFLVCLGVNGMAQNNKKSELRNLFKAPSNHNQYSNYIKKSSNELEFTAATLFLSYKLVFSSQDMQSCVFYPSCSVYAIECLREDPLPKSVFRIFDRLTRCHPLASTKYYTIHKSGQLYDPVHQH